MRFAFQKCFIRVIERRNEVTTSPLNHLRKTRGQALTWSFAFNVHAPCPTISLIFPSECDRFHTCSSKVQRGVGKTHKTVAKWINSICNERARAGKITVQLEDGAVGPAGSGHLYALSEPSTGSASHQPGGWTRPVVGDPVVDVMLEGATPQGPTLSGCEVRHRWQTLAKKCRSAHAATNRRSLYL